MPNIYAGITNLAEGNELAQFDYLGYRVTLDTVDRFAAISHPLHGDFRTTLNRAGRKPKMKDFIRAAKEAVIEHFDQDSRRESRERNEEVMGRVEIIDTERGAIESYMYKGHQIDIVPDDFPQDCPWDDWDQEPTALEYFRGGWSHAFGKNHEVSLSGQYSAEFMMRYINIAHGGVSEWFSTRSNNYIAYFTGKEIREWFDGDREFARYALSRSILTFEDWAEYGPHAYKVSRDGEEIDAMWGIYDHESYAYAVSEAMAMIDSDIKARKEESDMWEEEIRGEIEAETGQSVNLAR